LSRYNDDDNIEIIISDLIFKLKFIAGALPTISAAADGKVLTITFTGFDNPLGQGWYSSVGTYQNKERAGPGNLHRAISGVSA
jgi:hypothetical protein